MRLIATFAFIAILVAGCATPYQPTGLTGGFDTTKLGENSYSVTFRANAYTSGDRARDFTLLRAADVALENGCPYFLSDKGVEINGGLAWSDSIQFVCYKSKPQSQGVVYDAHLIHDSISKKYELSDTATADTGASADPDGATTAHPMASASPGAAPIAPATVPAAPQIANSPPSANVAPAGSITSFSGKRLAVKVLDNCPPDDDDEYCDEKTREALRQKVAASISSKGIFASVGDSSPDLVLDVMLTHYLLDTPGGGFLGAIADFAATIKGSANFQLSDATGHVLLSGSATGKDSDDDDVVWQQMADAIAAALEVGTPPQ